MRKLASIQRILALNPIPNADAIDVATVLGWQLVVKKGEFQVNGLAVYVEVDGLLPQKPEFEFLRPRNFRIRTVRLRGQVSQGICFPLSILPPGIDAVEGLDVSEALGITKYEPPIPAELAGMIKGVFPGWVPQTDEPRIQSNPQLLVEMAGRPWYYTEKIDGTSATFAYRDGEFEICSRNFSLKESETNTYWRMFRKYHLAEILPKLGNYAIQGEIAGPGIQKNRYGLKEHELFVFNIYDVDKSTYLPFGRVDEICREHHLQTVPFRGQGEKFDLDIPQLLNLAKGQYPTGRPREGIVIRPCQETYSPTLGGRLSFKTINNDFLLKEAD